ncbi:MAG TPA: hypothetical protein VEU62_10885 [Bryobacterales bacterium]|nr:hypothetical protein [Bryobacterales bacterium]
MILRRSFGFFLAALFALLVIPALAADISGDWNFKASSPEGEHPAKLTINQQGEKISGVFTSDRGEFKVEGTLKGNAIKFALKYTGGDEPMLIPFDGKLEGNKMSGEYHAGETTGAWSAEKAK